MGLKVPPIIKCVKTEIPCYHYLCDNRTDIGNNTGNAIGNPIGDFIGNPIGQMKGDIK